MWIFFTTFTEFFMVYLPARHLIFPFFFLNSAHFAKAHIKRAHNTQNYSRGTFREMLTNCMVNDSCEYIHYIRFYVTKYSGVLRRLLDSYTDFLNYISISFPIFIPRLPALLKFENILTKSIAEGLQMATHDQVTFELNHKFKRPMKHTPHAHTFSNKHVRSRITDLSHEHPHLNSENRVECTHRVSEKIHEFESLLALLFEDVQQLLYLRNIASIEYVVKSKIDPALQTADAFLHFCKRLKDTFQRIR